MFWPINPRFGMTKTHDKRINELKNYTDDKIKFFNTNEELDSVLK